MNRSLRAQGPSHTPFFAFLISIAVLAMLAAGI